MTTEKKPHPKLKTYPKFSYEEIFEKWRENYHEDNFVPVAMLDKEGWGIVKCLNCFWLVHFCYERADPALSSNKKSIFNFLNFCPHCKVEVKDKYKTMINLMGMFS